MVTAANFFADKAVLPPLIPPQLATSREHSLDRFPTISMRSSSWKELLDRMLLPPNPNVLSCHTGKNHAMLTLCSFTSGVPEALGAAGRYQRGGVTARISNRRHTAKPRRYESSHKFPWTVVGPLTLWQGLRDLRSWNGDPISHTQATTNELAKNA